MGLYCIFGGIGLLLIALFIYGEVTRPCYAKKRGLVSLSDDPPQPGDDLARVAQRYELARERFYSSGDPYGCERLEGESDKTYVIRFMRCRLKQIGPKMIESALDYHVPLAQAEEQARSAVASYEKAMKASGLFDLVSKKPEHPNAKPRLEVLE